MRWVPVVAALAKLGGVIPENQIQTLSSRNWDLGLSGYRVKALGCSFGAPDSEVFMHKSDLYRTLHEMIQFPTVPSTKCQGPSRFESGCVQVCRLWNFRALVSLVLMVWGVARV